MGAAFTNLFGRDFIVAHCLPAAVFLILFLGIFAAVGAQAPWAQPYVHDLVDLKHAEIKAAVTDASLAWTLAAFLVTTWLLGLVLYSVNTQVVRFFEGYGGWANPFRCLKVLQHRRLRKVEAFVREFKAKALAARAAGKDLPHDPAYQKAREELANRFPDEANLMPTRFGNTVRAFEVYPREMYGLEGVTGWFRLVAVVPKDYFVFIGSSRAQVDLCLNLTLVLWLCVLEYFVMCAVTFGTDVHLYPWPWLSAVLIAWAWFAIRSASSAAVIWGGWVKAAFDVYLNDLRTKLSFDAFESMESERHRWEGFSQAIGYHSPKQLRHRKPAPVPEDVGVEKPGFSAVIAKFFSALLR
jgi:hypothetical protein